MFPFRTVAVCSLLMLSVAGMNLFAADAEKKGAKPATPRLYDAGVPETGFLTLETEHYTVPLDAASGWTIEKMLYDGKTFSLNNGHYGTVLQPKGGTWWGTGHKEGGREVVHRLKLVVDGKDVPIKKTGETVSGKRIEFTKESTIWKFKVRSEVIVTNDYVEEQTVLEATEDIETGLMYYFMHCFPPVTTKWIAQLPDGKTETGPLSHSQKMAVNQDTTWVAQYNPEDQWGLLCYTPRVIAGNQSASHIWDLDRYHKYYLRHNRGQSFKKGETLDYTVIVKVVPDETGDWEVTRQAAAELMQQFPPIK